MACTRSADRTGDSDTADRRRGSDRRGNFLLPPTFRALPERQDGGTTCDVPPGLEETDDRPCLVDERENGDPIASTVDVTVGGEDGDGRVGRW